ncbi:MAG: hypothetical protein LH610_02465 [Sphingomonas bacterium]|nr:hypothetical protein [Sphingomonas bacterium]
MIRAIVLALSAALLLAPTQPTGPAPLVAKPKWVINYADSFCLLSRDRSLTEAGVALRTRPFADNHEFALLLPPGADRPFNAQGKVMVSDMATGVDRWIGMGTSKQAEGRVVETSITASELAVAIASARIRIVVPGKFDTAIKLPNMAKAAEVLRACEDDLAKRWKIARNWVTDPKLVPDSRGQFRHSD